VCPRQLLRACACEELLLACAWELLLPACASEERGAPPSLTTPSLSRRKSSSKAVVTVVKAVVKHEGQ
jgi:hypothetical protein